MAYHTRLTGGYSDEVTPRARFTTDTVSSRDRSRSRDDGLEL